jgi:hypothetical protein
MATLLNIKSLRFFHGYKYDVVGKTALLNLEITGEIPDRVLDYLEVWEGFSSLHPAENLFGVPETKWVEHFLARGRGASRFADIMAALLVVLQLWGRSPVHKAQVVTTFPDRIHLALPWQRQKLFREAVALAIDIVSILAAQRDVTVVGLQDRVASFLRRMQPGGVAPNTMRFACSAMARGMPVADTDRLGRTCAQFQEQLFRSNAFTGRKGGAP